MQTKEIETISKVAKEEFSIEEFKHLNYQKELTTELDKLSGDFNNSIVNKIVLWKVNRYPIVSSETMTWLNKIKKSDVILNVELSKTVLKKLLESKRGIKLPMASAILRFKNPFIYQIIDQRVYRFIYGEELEITNNIDEQAELYLRYLKKLREVCEANKIPFEIADRVLYNMDKEYNKKIPLKGYGKRV